MFTVCPKCALTLVVTAQDLRVAQGYVRCGRCSNVFNAIVALTDDRGALANPTSQQNTASTTIIRKAPSLSDDAPVDPLSETGESEAIYAEPDPEEVKFQEVFTEPAPTPKKTPAPQTPPAKTSAPSAASPAQKGPENEKRYSDTEGIETFPENELEFNPAVTDVTKVFVEAAPVAFKGDPTGSFRKIVGGAAPEAESSGETPASARTASPGTTPSAPAGASHVAPTPPSKPKRPERDPEDIEIDIELRSLAARLDQTSHRPAPKSPAGAANDETVQHDERAVSGIGDIYAKAVPRPRDQPKQGGAAPRLQNEAGDSAAGSASESAIDTLTPAPPPPSRFMWWVAGAAVLCLVLVAQAIHHNRHSLATIAWLNRPLTRFYSAIGVSLVPSWDLHAYDVRQLGAFTNERGENTLTVRASLKNTAPQPLPMPLLRITMQDRYGNRIATRDVPPAGYAPGGVPPDAHLGAGQRIDAEMTFKDPGQNAVGFEIDACLPAAGGGVACANDATAPAPH